jgi:hypothetical protein
MAAVPVTPGALSCLVNPAASASSVLLRDLHHGLIRVADGWSPKYPRPAPDTAQQAPEEPKAQLWQERLWMCILAPAHVCHVEPEAKVTISGMHDILTPVVIRIDHDCLKLASFAFLIRSGILPFKCLFFADS